MFTNVRLASVVLLMVCSLTRAEEPVKSRTISVSGEGKVSAPQNVADINIGVLTHSESARRAISENSEKMTAVHKAIKERGIAAKDVQTASFTVKPQYTERQSSSSSEYVPRLIGYDVTNVVSITARDLTKFGELLDAVTTAGANQVNGIDLRIDDPDTLLDTARKKAMGDAKKKAELMAGEEGMVVGLPITINDEVSRRPPRQEMYSLGRSSPAAGMRVPIAEGEEELSVTVHVVYELKAPK